MKGRTLLGTAALPLLFGGLMSLLAPRNAAKAGTGRVKQRLRPADAAWPSVARWAKLNDDVGGQLAQVHFVFESCATEPDGAACLDARKNIGNPYWIGDQAAGTEVSGWFNAWTPAPSAYAVKARKVADIVAAVIF